VMDDRTTIVVMTRNRWEDLRHSLPRHDAPVIVVDNGSTDGTPRLVRQHFPDVRVVELDHNRGAGARNVGVQEAATPYVAFADDDSWWSPDALPRAADVLDRHPSVALVAARTLVGHDERLDDTSRMMADGQRHDGLPGPTVDGFLACSAVVRRDAYLACGGFDPVVFFMGEEERLAIDLRRSGWDLVYVDDVVAHHHPSTADDRQGRRVLASRNRLLTAVMRRPWRTVAGTAASLAAEGRPGWRALGRAAPRVPAALRARSGP
jgi:GT2 family glycosyltransferase